MNPESRPMIENVGAPVRSVERNDKPCTKCSERPRRGNQRWCPVCHAAYMVGYRARVKQQHTLVAESVSRETLESA